MKRGALALVVWLAAYPANGQAQSSLPTPIATTTLAGKVMPDGTTITVDAAGKISLSAGGSGCLVSGGAGIVLNNGASGCTTDTNITASAGALSLGASATAGSAIFGNATSGTVTLQPVTGALGSVTLSLPAATDTLVARTTTDTLTNKTLTSPLFTGSPATTGTTFGFQSGGVTGTLAWAPATSNKTITLPNGTTDFTATGGTSQFVKQASAGAALTVARPACGDLSDSGTACTAATGTSGATLPLLNGTNTFSGTQSFGAVIGGIITDATTARTLGAGDCGQTINFTSGSAITVTTANLAVGCHIVVRQGGAGQITIAAGASTTIVSSSSWTKTRARYSKLGLSIIATTVTDIDGDGA